MAGEIVQSTGRPKEFFLFGFKVEFFEDIYKMLRTCGLILLWTK